MLIPLLLSLQALAGQAELPPSPAARAWAGVGPSTPAAAIDAQLLQDEAWLRAPREAAPQILWERWGTWLKQERGQEQADPKRRAGLLLLATSDSRWDDAWAHFARLGAQPEWAAAMLPHLLLGLPIEHPVEPGGRPAPLPDNVLLLPGIPPAPAGSPPGSLVLRAATFPGLRIGEAVVDLQITIEASGVQVDLVHVSGGAARVRVLLPEPEGHEIRVEYTDWMREDIPRAELTLELLPGSEEHNLFGRFSRRMERLPGLPLGELSGGLKRGGLWFECEPESNLAREAGPFSQALGALFELPTGLCAPGAIPPPSVWTQTRCRLTVDGDKRTRLLALVSLAERYALGGAR